MPRVEFCSTTDVSAKTLADIFWDMDCLQQAEFFNCLSEKDDHLHREMQWLYLAEELKKPENEKGKKELMNLAAFLYLHLIKEF